jgi:transcriptional regulator of acetoin/glycerol metabolism
VRNGDHFGAPDVILHSWQRCLDDYGLNPGAIKPAPNSEVVLTKPEFAQRLAPFEEFMAVAKPELSRLFKRFGDHGYFITLSERHAVTLGIYCTPERRPECRKSGQLAGSCWSEELKGTNGIGTCLRDERSVLVVGDDHFFGEFQHLTCAAASIHGELGRSIGALNITALQPLPQAAGSLLLDVVERSARRIERTYFARRNRNAVLVRLSPHEDFSDFSCEHWLAVDAGQRILDATRSTAMFFDAPFDRLIGSRLNDILDVQDIFNRDDSLRISSKSGARLFMRSSTQTIGRSAPRKQCHSAGTDLACHRAKEKIAIAELVGHDPEVTEEVRVALRLVNCKLPILVQGETGTGKTTLARALHEASVRADGPIVTLSCAAFTEELIESALFGYRPGAFTGAARDGASGLILKANHGTLFLDEIGDMPLHLQSRLLQVLSDGEFLPVGGTQSIRVDIAVISATLYDLRVLVEQRRFREDLFFRLSGTTVRMRPLRERTDRLHVIASAFRNEARAIGAGEVALSPEVTVLLRDYPWPGNIRELVHVARYAVALKEGPTIGLSDLPKAFNHASAQDSEKPILLAKSEAERRTLMLMLDQSGWNVSQAAQRLGISRATLHRKINVYGLLRRR